MIHLELRSCGKNITRLSKITCRRWYQSINGSDLNTQLCKALHTLCLFLDVVAKAEDTAANSLKSII